MGAWTAAKLTQVVMHQKHSNKWSTVKICNDKIMEIQMAFYGR